MGSSGAIVTPASIGADTRFTTVATKTSAYPALAWQIVPVDTTAAPVTITLPVASTAGIQVCVLLVAGTNPATIARAGSDLIDGATTATITLIGADRLLVADGGSGWKTVAGHNTLASLDGRFAALTGAAFTGAITAPTVGATGTTGAPLPGRFVGVTAAGPPTSGTYAVADYVLDQQGREWICITAGTPGAWKGTADYSAWTPGDYSWLAWTQPPQTLVGTWSGQVVGLMYAVNLKMHRPGPVTNIIMANPTAGTTLTANQCYAELRNTTTGALIGRTADQSTAWSSIAVQVMPLAGGPYTVTDRVVTVTFWANGTTMPVWRQGLASGLVNQGFAGVNMLSAWTDAGITTAASSPATLGARTAQSTSPWVGLS